MLSTLPPDRVPTTSEIKSGELPNDSHLPSKLVNNISQQGFCEQVGNHILGWNVYRLDLSIIDYLAKPKPVAVKVLEVAHVFWLFGHQDC